MVTAFAADDDADFNVYQVAGGLNSVGFTSRAVSFHLAYIAVTLRHADVIDDIITALEEAVLEAKATPEPEGMKSGVAIYGKLMCSKQNKTLRACSSGWATPLICPRMLL